MMPNPLRYKWEFFGAVGVPLYASIFPPLYTLGFQERYRRHLQVFNIYKDRRIEWFMRSDQLSKFAEYILPTLLEEKWGYYERWQMELKPWKEIQAKFLHTDFRRFTESELKEVMREYRSVFGKPFVTDNIIEPLSYYFQHHLKELLIENGVPAEQALELIQQYGQAARPSYVKLCALAYKKAKTEKEKQVVLQEYYYIHSDYNGVKAFTKSDVEELANTTTLIPAHTQSSEGLSEKAASLLTVFQIISTIQDVRKGGFLQMVTIANKFGEAWATKRNIPFEDIEYATWLELERGGVFSGVYAKRREICTVYWTVDGEFVKSGKQAEELREKIHADVFKIDSNQAEIKGVGASRGSAYGRAVIIFDPSEFDQIQPGDILITVMTRPEFLPAMHRAAAFVCDEGGLTSHAAIIAREMRKPCVIATKLATKVFKTGDMVEVNADQGIVRKLK